jgi:hypothetical protein
MFPVYIVDLQEQPPISNEERQSHFLLTLPPSDPIPDTRNSYFFFLNLAPTSPTNPVPKRSMVPESQSKRFREKVNRLLFETW